MNLGGPEALILLAVVILVFGAGWLPKAAKNLGKAKVELDKVQKQVNETKDQVVEATGVKELEATMRKANKVMNTSPQGLLKGAAASAIKPSTSTPANETDAQDGPTANAADVAATEDDGIEDAVIVPTPESEADDANQFVDFDE